MFLEYLVYWKRELIALKYKDVKNNKFLAALKSINSYIRTLNYFEEREREMPKWLSLELDEFLQKLNSKFYLDCKKGAVK